MPTRDCLLRSTNEATDSRARHEAEAATGALVRALDRVLVVDREQLAATLAWHLLSGPECDHGAKTDVAACACGQWRSEPLPSVGAAIDAWAQHVIATLAAEASK